MKRLPSTLPDVSVLIAAYNEEAIIHSKMKNCMQFNYPKEKLHIVWVTDGSNDATNSLLSEYPDVTVLFDPKRGGKSAALNRAMPYISSPITIFTDANTMVNSEAINEIVKEFTDPRVGCVAGEKRVKINTKQNATAGEGIYWKYESKLKQLDYRLNSAVGAAGELFSIRTNLFIELPSDTLLDDFIMSMKIAQRGFIIAYCSNAYALEDSSPNIKEEEKRKVRISAGGLQSIYRLRDLLIPIPNPILTFQYVSHRVLRWSLTPISLVLVFILNFILCFDGILLYKIFFLLQVLFYIASCIGKYLADKQIKNKYFFVPFYFTMMNINVLKGYSYLIKHRGTGVWEKAKR